MIWLESALFALCSCICSVVMTSQMIPLCSMAIAELCRGRGQRQRKQILNSGEWLWKLEECTGSSILNTALSVELVTFCIVVVSTKCFITTQLVVWLTSILPVHGSTGLNILLEPSDGTSYIAYYSQQGLYRNLWQETTSADCHGTVSQKDKKNHLHSFCTNNTVQMCTAQSTGYF